MKADWLIILKNYIEMEYRPINTRGLLDEKDLRLGVPFLGKLPIDPRISELCDAGNIETYPTVEFSAITRRLVEIAPEPRRSPVQPR